MEETNGAQRDNMDYARYDTEQLPQTYAPRAPQCGGEQTSTRQTRLKEPRADAKRGARPIWFTTKPQRTVGSSEVALTWTRHQTNRPPTRQNPQNRLPGCSTMPSFPIPGHTHTTRKRQTEEAAPVSPPRPVTVGSRVVRKSRPW